MSKYGRVLGRYSATKAQDQISHSVRALECPRIRSEPKKIQAAHPLLVTLLLMSNPRGILAHANPKKLAL